MSSWYGHQRAEVPNMYFETLTPQGGSLSLRYHPPACGQGGSCVLHSDHPTPEPCHLLLEKCRDEESREEAVDQDSETRGEIESESWC